MENNNITINPVYEILSLMPFFKQLKIEIINLDDSVEFKKGEVSVKMKNMDIVGLGAKSIARMFQTLEE
jgi:hypothetical protein